MPPDEYSHQENHFFPTQSGSLDMNCVKKKISIHLPIWRIRIQYTKVNPFVKGDIILLR